MIEEQLGIAKPMYFSSLEIENVKSFGQKVLLDLKDKDGALSPWTLILGDNGVGKTTLLKCLAWMTPVEAPPETNDKEEIDSDSESVFLKPYMDDLDESNFELLIRDRDTVNTSINIQLTNGVILGDKPTAETTLSLGMEFVKINGKLKVVSPHKARITSYNSPNVFAYSANRHLAHKNLENSELKDPISNLFSDSGDLYDAEQILSMLDTASIRQDGKGKATDLLQKIKEILTDLLPDIKDPTAIIVNSPINEDGSINKHLVEVKTDDGKIKLFGLSLGYATMLSWVVDLAVRMLWRFPDSDEPLKEPAIVIVDEIDLHLHPIWQQMIMRKLTFHFPSTQFICTAHSPIMAQASEAQNLSVVKRLGDDVIIENEPTIVKGWRIGQLLTSELFDFETDRGLEVDEKIKRRRELLKIGSLSGDESIELARLNSEIEDLPIGDTQKEVDATEVLKIFAKKLNALKTSLDKDK